MNDSTSYLTGDDIKLWFTDPELIDELRDELYELPYQDEGYVIDLPHVTDYQVTLHAKNTNRSYDSYGNGYLEDGYIVLAVSGLDGSTKYFKVPYSYASYEGWNHDLDNVTETVLREKVITRWESI